MDVRPAVQFDNKPTLSFAQGEDRTITVTLYDADYITPINLTGAQVGINFPLQGGGSVKKMLAGPNFIPPDVSIVTGLVTLPDHGLVNGDPVTISGGTLPAPLMTATTYYIQFVDANTFGFMDVNGVAIPLTGIGSGTFVLQSTDITMSTPTTGQFVLTLRAAVSLVINPGPNQDCQIEYTISSKTRILIAARALTVVAQPVP